MIDRRRKLDVHMAGEPIRRSKRVQKLRRERRAEAIVSHVVGEMWLLLKQPKLVAVRRDADGPIVRHKNVDIVG